MKFDKCNKMFIKYVRFFDDFFVRIKVDYEKYIDSLYNQEKFNIVVEVKFCLFFRRLNYKLFEFVKYN